MGGGSHGQFGQARVSRSGCLSQIQPPIQACTAGVAETCKVLLTATPRPWVSPCGVQESPSSASQSPEHPLQELHRPEGAS